MPPPKSEDSKAATGETRPATKRVVGPKPVKKTTPGKPGEPVDPYAE
jgi:hypothetical protein